MCDLCAWAEVGGRTVVEDRLARSGSWAIVPVGRRAYASAGELSRSKRGEAAAAMALGWPGCRCASRFQIGGRNNFNRD